MQHHAFTKESLEEYLISVGFELFADIWALGGVTVKASDGECSVWWRPAGWKQMKFSGYSEPYIRNFINDKVINEVMIA